MRHLIVSREYPPAPYVPGGIGTYVETIARLMAERGETVHVIAQRWPGAPRERETFVEGRLVVHRIGEDDPPPAGDRAASERRGEELRGLRATAFPNQWFAWSAAFLAEHVIEQEGIDVIEGQEWEAPLFYLLLRRALGLGPRRVPPCIVHLHSASAVIRHFNGALSVPPAYPSMKRMEEFCIRSADALLCPSRFFADQCSRYFDLPRDRITVIPLPAGFTPLLERSRDIWADGAICFVGRLEPRKGIIEWVEAASRVAGEHPSVHFDFVGADIWGLRSQLEGRLPADLRPRFRFHGSKPRRDLLPFLARAKAAVVPSRWENFPSVCIEAMSSGLPVIATRLGGMVELVEDDRTGWLAPETGVAGMVEGLATALRRCLAASPEMRASMGLAASQSVRRYCDNAAIVDAQLAFRAAVAGRGAERSLSLARAGRPADPGDRLPSSGGGSRPVLRAGIVVCTDSRAAAEPVLRSLEAQSMLPQIVVVVCADAATGPEPPFHRGEGACEVLALHRPELRGAAAWNAGFLAAQDRREVGFWLFLDADDGLAPSCLERCAAVFAHRPEVGVVAPWTVRATAVRVLEVAPCPDSSHQLTGNDVPPASAFRATALGGAVPFRPGMPREYDVWDAANRVLARGWSAVTFPETLAVRRRARPAFGWPEATALRAIRGELLMSLTDAITRGARDLIDDYVPLPGASPPQESAAGEPWRQRVLRHLVTLVVHPRVAARLLLERTTPVLARLGRRFRPRSRSAASW